ncbi:hypothetical protein [Streptomyces sp. P9-A4]|uniref:hypothetical protein n=1 Tax=Streptomyces sp. P9-A4 TaxID=3072285 RepID=UPI002FC6AA4E
MLTMVGDVGLPTVHCSHACADYTWLERTLATAPDTALTPMAEAGMEKLRDALDARREPTDIGPLVEL